MGSQNTEPHAAALPPAANHLPTVPVDRWARPFVRFLQIESASGVLLLVCTLLALIVANSPWKDAFASYWNIHLRVGIGSWELNASLQHWVNDGLMTIFFFVVGLEIKREIAIGELRDARKAALPVMAALGGMIAPALVYLMLRSDESSQAGWGIPMATDIAFVVGFLALLGPRVPLGLKVLLLSLAIADDIGAVLVIACFYSSHISLLALGLAALGMVVVYALKRIGVRSASVYFVVGAGIWLALLHSGVHPTIAGVVLGLMTPAEAWIVDQTLISVLHDVLHRWQSRTGAVVEHHDRPVLADLETAAREAVSPVERLESRLHPWVAFGIMPIFALANAGVTVKWSDLGQEVTLAVAAGLFLGKPLGIMLFSWTAVRLGLARLPAGVNWKVMLGAGCLAGIGFTMSLFIAGLALNGDLLDAGKIGTVAGSTLSAIVGCALLRRFLPKPARCLTGRQRTAIRKRLQEAMKAHDAEAGNFGKPETGSP